MKWHAEPALEPSICMGAWEREAARVQALADARRLVLDPELLILSDVRDLQALKLRLQKQRASLPLLGRYAIKV